MDLHASQIRINNILLNVTIEGTGPDVILLHGFPDSSYVWRNQIPALAAAGFRVIAPDLRGCGDSEAPQGRGAYAIDAIIADILALMAHLGIGKASIIAHDWGANIGWIFASRHPEKVDRYVALSVGHTKAYRYAGIRQVQRAWYAALFLLPVAETIFSAMNWRFLRWISNGHPETDHWIRNLSRPGRLTAGLGWYRDNSVSMLTEDVPMTRVPCMGVWSSADRFLTEKQMMDSAKYVDAPWQYRRIVGIQHWMQLDAPQLLNKILVDYLRQTP